MSIKEISNIRVFELLTKQDSFLASVGVHRSAGTYEMCVTLHSYWVMGVQSAERAQEQGGCRNINSI